MSGEKASRKEVYDRTVADEQTSVKEQRNDEQQLRLLSARIGGLESQLKNFDETEDIFNRNLKRGSGEIFWDFMSELGVSGGSMAICPIDQHNSVRKQDEEQTENILRTPKKKVKKISFLSSFFKILA